MPFQFYTDTSGPQHLVVLIFIYFSISVKESWVLKRIDGWRQVSSWSTNYKIRSPHTYIKSTSIILLFLRSNNFLVPFSSIFSAFCHVVILGFHLINCRVVFCFCRFFFCFISRRTWGYSYYYTFSFSNRKKSEQVQKGLPRRLFLCILAGVMRFKEKCP